MPNPLIRAAAAGALAALLSGPALASACGDRLSALDRKVDERGDAAIASSSGGQGVAAAREGQAQQPSAERRPPVPFQSTGQEAAATRSAAQSGGGGDGVTRARAALNRARTLDGQGNEAGCMDAATEAERLLAQPG